MFTKLVRFGHMHPLQGTFACKASYVSPGMTSAGTNPPRGQAAI